MQHALSVVVPAFNEAGNLPDLIDQIFRVFLEEAYPARECIVVDDASTDNTEFTMHELMQRYTGLRYIKMRKNSGQSAALLTGMRSAQGEYIITLDGDLQNDPADIPKIVDALAQADCVCGYRENRQDSWGRLLSSYCGNLVRRQIVDDGIRDAGCGLKGFRRECIPHLLPFHGVHRFFAAMVKNAGLRVIEVPIRHHPRKAGQSKYNFRNRFFWVLYDFIGVAWLRRRYLLIESEEVTAITLQPTESFTAISASSENKLFPHAPSHRL
ncbi:MAG: glycosyltransferase family 2 protein [Candidatus Hydrogenedentes bacterium]|jgi:dolichol-phosphate mannosyltransferase|nr:glycosyltransferase family 2 protein [Candidatus Hydrogenedentota bacterium]